MVKDIFKEVFGDINWEKFVNDLSKEFKIEDNEKDSSYYHKIEDEYNDGKHISHKEKEIKDGKVLKDVNETYQIEDKKCNNSYKNCECNDLLKEAEETIKKQNLEIEKYQDRCKELEDKLSEIEKIFNKK